MTDRCSYAVAQELLSRQRFTDALRIAGPLLEAHPDNFPAWYQVASASAHMNPGNATIKNLENAALALPKGLFPLQGLMALRDDLLSEKTKHDLLQELLTRYGSDVAPSLRHQVVRSTPYIDAMPWSPQLPANEISQMADSLLAMAWGNSLEALQRFPEKGYMTLFSVLAPDSFETILNSVEIYYAKANERLVSKGSRSNTIMILAYGRAHCELDIGHGKMIEFSFLENDVIGEESLLTGNPESAEIIASEPTTLLRLPVETVTRTVEKNPEMATELARLYQKKILSALLLEHPLLTFLTPNERVHLLHQMQPSFLDAQGCVFPDGAPDEVADSGSFLVLSGGIAEIEASAAAIGKPSANASNANYRRGDWIDLEKWQLLRADNARLVATENTVSLKLSRDEFHAILSRYPQVIEAMYPLRESN